MRPGWKVRREVRWLPAFLLAAALAACGDDGSPNPIEPDPALAPFVGTWDAEVFTVTSDADPDIVADLMENGSFFINVQPSGTYTASLEFGGIPLSPEIGQMTVSGDVITLNPNGAESATSKFTFISEEYLRLEGPTEFDFNLDGELEPAQAYIELRRR